MAPNKYEPLITVSATYGAGGSVIAPRLAAELGLPFIDRYISADSVQASQEGLVKGEQEASPVGRFLSYFARAATVGVVIGPEPDIQNDDDIRDKAETDLKAVTGGAPGVVLGRAGAIVLKDRPRAYHVRLDGPAEQRLVWASSHEQLDRDAAAKRQSETDRARTAFVKRLYRVDPGSPSLYHLVIDPTAIGVDATVSVIKTASAAFFDQTAG
ncbi:MAG TPA: cytidylate kinase-like family protein [Acidimicrobiales bacterium]|nr:cytidylate kinase-like family protein [Acidimicrobiales bacterium]